MKIDGVLSVVPKPVRNGAWVLLGCAVLIGSMVGFTEATVGSGIGVHGETITGLGAGLIAGVLGAIWVLGLGYVFGDAKRRRMPPVPWTLIAALAPNLLGFLLYFVMRRPIASPCGQCGQLVAAEQRFCPWCGTRGPLTPDGENYASSV